MPQAGKCVYRVSNEPGAMYCHAPTVGDSNLCAEHDRMIGRDNVEDIRPHLTEVGPGYRFDPDEVLEKAKGQGFTNIVIIGQLPDDDELYVAGNANAGECLIMMELAKLQLLGK